MERSRTHPKARPRLILNCGGGLGNQMFEYAAGLYFSRKFDRTLEVVKPAAKHQNWNGFSRPFQLSEFAIEAPVREAGWRERVFFSTNPRLRSLQSSLGKLTGAGLLEDAHPYTYSASPQHNSQKRTLFMVGNWQAAVYAEGVEAELRRSFTLRNALAPHNAGYARRIRELSCAVSIHLRLGDYALIQHATGDGGKVSMLLRPSYYHTARRAVAEAFPNYTPVVFSDDPQRARNFFKVDRECLFIEGNDPSLAHQDLYLMSLCRHHVIANSTFSWWGAWLNSAPQRRVFAPKYWANTPSSFFPDLLPKDWTAIDNCV